MSTTKTRICIYLPDYVKDALNRFVRRDRMPAATKVARLLEAALEIEEDEVWDALAQQRNTSKTKFVDHDTAWR